LRAGDAWPAAFFAGFALAGVAANASAVASAQPSPTFT
jgi:hypothetical protein